jgi:hypothetical protein
MMFDRLNRMAIHVRGWHQAATDRCAIDHYRASAADAAAADEFGAGQSDSIANNIGRGFIVPRLKFKRASIMAGAIIPVRTTTKTETLLTRSPT